VPQARRIRETERDAALAMVVEAFRSDPQVRWWFPDDGSYEPSAAHFFGFLLDTRMGGGEVWVVDGVHAISIWIPPGGNLLGPDVVATRYAEIVAHLPAPAPERILAMDEMVDALLPREPHWYLGVLACRRSCRGQGLGSAVAAPVLAAADRAGLPVALETSTASNVDLYTRRGFAVVGQISTGGATDPVVWVMRREPMPPALTSP
jgi:GNAT superfamily N-acetyltransferase